MRAMPRTAIGIDLGIRDRCQRAVRTPPFVGGSGVVNGGTKERMTERHSCSHRNQFGPLRRCNRLDRDTKSRSGSPEKHGIAERFGSSDEQQSLRLVGKPVDLPAKACLHAPHERQRRSDGEAAREARGRDTARKLEQRERIATCLVDDSLTDAFVEPSRCRRGEQLACVGVRQSRQDKLGQPGELGWLVLVALGEQHEYRLRLETPRDERQDMGRAAVEPLRVVDDADQRLRLGRVREQRQHREPDEEAIGALTRHQPERCSQRVALGRRQPLEIVEEQRHAQLMECRERKLHLRLDASGTDDPAPLARARGVIQKGRLSHAGLRTHNERAALSTTHRAQHLIERCTLTGAAPEHRTRQAGDEGQQDARAPSLGLAADRDAAHCRSNKPPPTQLKSRVGESRSPPDRGQVVQQRLTALQERDLVIAAERGDSDACRELVEAFLPAIGELARGFRNSKVERLELLQEGVAGLLVAARRFDTTLNTPFWSYASFWVRKSMQELVADLTRPVALSDRAVRELARVKRARSEHLQLHGVEPAADELGRATGLTAAQIERLQATERTPRSMQEQLAAGDEATATVGDTIVDPTAEHAYQQVLDAFEIRDVRDLSEQLDERERTVIRAHYGLGQDAQTLSEIGAGLGLSTERARQIEAAALSKLRAALTQSAPVGGYDLKPRLAGLLKDHADER
jgi:RNA polymerase primary sigma factor